jgi:hypothetical protein
MSFLITRGLGGPFLLTGGLGRGSVILPYDLEEAIVTRLRAVFPTVPLDDGYVSPGQDLPSMEVYHVTETPSFMTGTPFLISGHAQINVYATSRVAARQLGDQVEAALKVSNLDNQSCNVMAFLPGPHFSGKDPDPGPDGGPVYQEARTFTFDASSR